MIVGILATDGGPHSAEAWAGVTASQIIQVAADASGVRATDARRLELQVLDILAGFHAGLQAYERKRLDDSRNGVARCSFDIVPEKHIDDPLAAIVAAAQGGQFASHFNDADVQAHIRQVLGSHFATSIQIERSWKADSQPDAEESRAFRARWNG